MELRSLQLSRSSYGDDKGLLKGTLTVTTRSGDIALAITEDKAERILAIVSEQLVDTAKEVADNITREIIEHKPALEDKSGE